MRSNSTGTATARFIRHVASAVCFCLPSLLTRPLYRALGHRIGHNTAIPMFAYVYGDDIVLGNDVDIRPLAFIHVTHLRLGHNTIISFGVQIKGDAAFEAGDNCFVGAHTIIHCDENVRFGFYSGVGPRSLIYTHGSFLPVTLGYPALFAPVELEDFVWCAMGVQFLPGAHVESHCMINCGVVVSGRVASHSRVQLSEDAVRVLDLERLRKFALRPAGVHHQAMIRSFLDRHGLAWEAREGTYRFGGGLSYRSNPATNRIEFWSEDRRLALYDLDAFECTPCRHPLHRRWLRHLRRRFGVTLRTRYDPPTRAACPR